MQIIRHSRGTPFSHRIIAMEQDRSIVKLTGYSISSQIRTKGGSLVATVTISNRSDASGEFDAGVSNTSGWPLEDIYMDVQYITPDGLRESSETVMIIVDEGGA